MISFTSFVPRLFRQQPEKPMDHFTCTRAELPPSLARTVFEDRSRQFVDRLNWSLTVTPDGLELDEYDDDQSVYLVVAKGMRHLGSCRVRSVRASTMLVDHFLHIFPDAEEFLRQQRGRVWELTRFCRAPDIPVEVSRRMLERLAALLDGFRDRHRLTGFVAVVFPEITRFLDSIGVRYLTVSRGDMAGRAVHLICITHSVRVLEPEAQTVQEAAERLPEAA
jgi:acyl homoserine lactone synthase